MKKTVVLVVDDNPEVVEVLGELIEDGCKSTKVLSCLSIFEASKIIETFAIDIVVCDENVHGSEIKGHMFASKVKGYQPKCRFWLMSGNPRNSEHASNTAIDGFLEKPFNLGDILGAVSGYEVKRAA